MLRRMVVPETNRTAGTGHALHKLLPSSTGSASRRSVLLEELIAIQIVIVGVLIPVVSCGGMWFPIPIQVHKDDSPLIEYDAPTQPYYSTVGTWP